MKRLPPSALREHICDMGLWHSLQFRTIKGLENIYVTWVYGIVYDFRQ
jgi:hypothetical protein